MAIELGTVGLLRSNNLSDVLSVASTTANLNLGSASLLNAGTLSGNVLLINSDNKLPILDGSSLTGLNSPKYDSVYSTVSANSSNFNSVYSSVNSNSSIWNNTYTTVLNNSSIWNLSGGSSSNVLYDSVYSTVSANSSTWGNGGTNSKYDSNFNTTSANSGNWNSVYSTVRTNSSSWGLGGSGGGSWGSISGTLSAQTDLYNSLTGKVDKTTTINGYPLSGGNIVIPGLSGSITTEYQLVERWTASGNTTSYTFNNLNGNRDRRYKIVHRIIGGSNSASTVFLTCNSDNTATHYPYRYNASLAGQFFGWSGNNNNGLVLGYTDSTNSYSFGEAILDGVTGCPRTYQNHYTQLSTDITAIYLYDAAWYDNNITPNSVNINQLTITSSISNGIGTGSYIELWKLNDGSGSVSSSNGGTWGSISGTLSAQTDLYNSLTGKVDKTTTINGYPLSGGNITIPGLSGSITTEYQLVERWEPSVNSTSYTFSNLNGNRDKRYKFVGILKNPIGSAVYNKLIINNDNTANNYTYQADAGIGTSQWSARTNGDSAGLMLSYNINGESCIIDGIMYASTAQPRWCLSHYARSNGGIIEAYSDYGQKWSNTADNITELKLQCDTTNGIGVGSVFELWKLNDGSSGVSSSGGGTWGSISGTLSAQTDLYSQLSAKLNTSIYASTSGNYSSVYSTVSANSATWGTGTGSTSSAMAGEYVLVERWTPTSNSTSYTFNNLNGNNDVRYKMVYRVVNALDYYGIRFNNDSGNNYGVQISAPYGTTPHVYNQQGMSYIRTGSGGNPNSQSVGEAVIFASTGIMRQSNSFSNETESNTGGTGSTYLIGGSWTNTSSNITSITFLSMTTNGIGVGSYVEIWKLNPNPSIVNSTVFNITKTSHSLTSGVLSGYPPITTSGTLAIANSPEGVETLGVLVGIPDSNTLRIQQTGLLNWPSHGFSGAVFVSPYTSGAWTMNTPAGNNFYIKPMLKVIDANNVEIVDYPASLGSSTNIQYGEIGLACSDETTDLSTGSGKLTFRMPYGMWLTDVRANVNTAPSGANIVIDVNKNGSSIFSTRLTLSSGFKTSVGSTSGYVISDNNLTDDSEITIDVDQVGSTIAGKGLKVWLKGQKL